MFFSISRLIGSYCRIVAVKLLLSLHDVVYNKLMMSTPEISSVYVHVKMQTNSMTSFPVKYMNSNTCLKRPPTEKTKIGLQDRSS